MAEKRPVVLMVACGLDPSIGLLLAEHLHESFSTSSSPARDSGQLLSRLEALPVKGTDILLLGAGISDFESGVSVPEYVANLREVVAHALRIRASLLWFNIPRASPLDASLAPYFLAAQGIMEEGGAGFIDFPGFAQNHEAAKFFAEGLGQWWAVCAKSNTRVHRFGIWPDRPPGFQKEGVERINSCGRVDRVSEPEITRFAPEVECRGTALIVFPGGGYSFLGFLRNALALGKILPPEGIAVFGLKYRTGRDAGVPLMDAQRAVRHVRHHAAEWGINPHRIGVAGISAGAHLALNLATHWSSGDPSEEDPVDRVSSRPDFVAAFSTWNFGSTESPFEFRQGDPPVFLRHARDDPAFPLGVMIAGQLEQAGVPANIEFPERGGHGAFDLIPGNPGAKWPGDLLMWLRSPGASQK